MTGADLRASHHESREDPYRLAVGLIGAEAMLRLFTEQEANERAFTALTRFLDRLDVIPSRAPAAPGARPARPLLPAEAALGVGLHAASRELRRVRRRRRARRLSARGRRRCLPRLRRPGTIPLSTEGVRAIQTLVATPLADAGEAGLTESRAREALAIVRASYEHQGGFRLRTLSA